MNCVPAGFVLFLSGIMIKMIEKTKEKRYNKNNLTNEISIKTKEKNMKIIFLGDSITEGVGASCPMNNYVCKVAEICEGVMTENFGVSGTRIARQTTPTEFRTFDYDFQMRCEVMSKDADKVFVFGGTNDYGHGDAPIGCENDDSPYTFHGGLNKVIKRLCEIYGKDKIAFILPTRRFDENDLFGEGHRTEPTLNLKGYVDIIRAKCEKFGIDYIDLYNDGLPKPATNTVDEFYVDGLHPNDKGHLLIAEKIKKYLGL